MSAGAGVAPAKPRSTTSVDQVTGRTALTDAWVFQGHTYQLIRKPQSWESARKDALARGGYLVEVQSEAENKMLFSKLRSKGALKSPAVNDGGGARYVWLGASDTVKEGSFIWATSRRSLAQGYLNWGVGAMGREPDNFDNQDAAAMALESWPLGAPEGAGMGRGGQWNDIQHSNSIFSVVEFDKILPVA